MFLGKTLFSHSTSLNPGVQMGAGKFNAGSNPVMDWHPIQGGGGGGVEILQVVSCYRNWDKLCLMGRLAHTDFTLTVSLFLQCSFTSLALVTFCSFDKIELLVHT